MHPYKFQKRIYPCYNYSMDKNLFRDFGEDLAFSENEQLLLAIFILEGSATEGWEDDLIALLKGNFVVLRSRSSSQNFTTVQALLSLLWDKNTSSSFLPMITAIVTRMWCTSRGLILETRIRSRRGMMRLPAID